MGGDATEPNSGPLTQNRSCSACMPVTLYSIMNIAPNLSRGYLAHASTSSTSFTTSHHHESSPRVITTSHHHPRPTCSSNLNLHANLHCKDATLARAPAAIARIQLPAPHPLSLPLPSLSRCWPNVPPCTGGSATKSVSFAASTWSTSLSLPSQCGGMPCSLLNTFSRSSAGTQCPGHL